MDARLQPAGPDPADGERKRRAIAQGQKACNPCRLRKVRCSYQSPCQTCVERQHPELCLYEAPSKRVRLAPMSAPSDASPSSSFSGPWLPSRDDWERLCGKIDKLEQGLQAMRRGLPGRGAAESRPRRHGTASDEDEPELSRQDGDMHTEHPLTGEPVFLGGNSVPAMAVALTKSHESDAVRHLLDNSILPIFALENESATYPFVDLWGLPHASTERLERLCSLLPPDAECIQYLRQYRNTAHVLFPAIVGMQQFEADITRFLVARNARSTDPNRLPLSEQNIHGKSVHWLGLLFACLASGCQCSGIALRRERQLTSQVYGKAPRHREWRTGAH